jgi:hypothetical protein
VVVALEEQMLLSMVAAEAVRLGAQVLREQAIKAL